MKAWISYISCSSSLNWHSCIVCDFCILHGKKLVWCWFKRFVRVEPLLGDSTFFFYLNLFKLNGCFWGLMKNLDNSIMIFEFIWGCKLWFSLLPFHCCSGLTQTNYKELNVLYEKYKSQGPSFILTESMYFIYSCMFSIIITLKLMKFQCFGQVLRYWHFLATSLQDKNQEAMRKFRKCAQGLKLNSQFSIRWFFTNKETKFENVLSAIHWYNSSMQLIKKQFQYANWLFLVWQSLKLPHQQRLNWWYWQQSVIHISLWQ